MSHGRRRRGIGAGPSLGSVEDSIVFWATERDKTNLAILAAAGLDAEAAIRLAVDSLAAEMTPAVWALSGAGARLAQA